MRLDDAHVRLAIATRLACPLAFRVPRTPRSIRRPARAPSGGVDGDFEA